VFKHTFANVGEMEVFAKVRDSLGGESVESVPAKVTIVNRAPTVSVSGTPTSGYRGDTFTFTAVGSDPDGDALVYSFNGGAFGASRTFSTTYNTVGNQTVRVRARDSQGAVSTEAAVTISITNRAPTVTLAANPASAVRGQTVTFTATGTDADGDALQYSFNGGAFAPSRTFSTSYNTVGNQSVRVKARDSQNTDSAEANVTVAITNRAPTVTLAANPTSAVRGQTVTFTATGTDADGDALQYSFNGGTFGESSVLSQAFSTTGTQTISVVAKDALGAISSPDSRDVAVTVEMYKVTFSVYAWTSGDWRAANARFSVKDATTGKTIANEAVQAYNPSGPKHVSKDFTLYVPYGHTLDMTGYGHVQSNDMHVGWKHGRYSQNYSSGGQYYTSVGWSETVTGNLSLGTFYIGTPLVLDLSGDDAPDLLAGGEWRQLPERMPSSNVKAYREIDLDGSGVKPWEWVGPTDGVLVLLEGLQGTPTGNHLFGTATYGKSWKNGFEALAVQDKDHNGTIEGSELEAIGIWIDGNSDAVAQDGEIKPAAEHGVQMLPTKYNTDAFGNTHSPRGAVVKGSNTTVWDWISYTYPELKDSDVVVQFDWTNQQPPDKFLKFESAEGMERINMLPGGSLIVYRIEGKLYVRAVARLEDNKVLDVVYPAQVTQDGILVWGAQGMKNSILPSGDNFYGVTVAGENKFGLWSAKIASGNYANLINKSE